MGNRRFKRVTSMICLALVLQTGCDDSGEGPAIEPLDISVLNMSPDGGQAAFDMAAPDPDMAIPDPDMAIPNPDMAIPNPDMAIPDPDMAAPDPDMAIPNPDMAIPDPDMAIPDPDMAIPDPDMAVELDVAPPELDAEPDVAIDAEPDAAIPFIACRDTFVTPPIWPDNLAEVPLPGHFSAGQTQVDDLPSERISPQLITEREGILLFTPDAPIPDDALMLVTAVLNGEQLGTLPLANTPVPIAESDLTQVALDPYALGAWHGILPWQWMREGVTLRVGYAADDTLHVTEKVLSDLGASHRFTISRAKLVLFGEPDFNASGNDPQKLARDFFPALPFAALRWVDALPWRLNEIIISTPNGPALVNSEASRRDLVDEDHWSIIKHQFALRMSLANTGRGLVLVVAGQGDSSPYSFGTSLGQGWFRDPDGNYHDIDDAPWAAGWTGWTAMWLGECGNGFIHEVGHSMTMAHFVGGTAESWGIADAYPLDGTHIETHPWGYHAIRRQMRTWYRVDSNGPVLEDGERVGKHDPMNGGEGANALGCFPQYTPYHARKAQLWAQGQRTIAEVDGQPGIYQWDADTGEYQSTEPDLNHQSPVAVDVPVLTIIGAFGTDVAQTYPAQHWPSGNVFDLPDPTTAGLPDIFQGARYMLRIEYANGDVDWALIAQGEINDDRLYAYSLNLAAEREPTRVELRYSEAGYPGIDLAQTEILHTREIAPPEADFQPVLTVGREQLGSGVLKLAEWCEQGRTCSSRAREATWRITEPLYFAEDTIECGDPINSSLTVEVTNEAGEVFDLIINLQRVVRGAGHEFRVPIEDASPWIQRDDAEQSLRAWVPWQVNAHLPAGRYRGIAPTIQARTAAGILAEIPIRIDLTLLTQIPVNLSDAPFRTPPTAADDSSQYYLVRDPSHGPTNRMWWGDGDPTRLTLPMRAPDDTLHTVIVRAQNDDCNGSRFSFNAGRGASPGDCEHQAVLWVDPTDNLDLAPNTHYQMDPSAPLIVESRRWHDPNGQSLLAAFALTVEYTTP